MQVQYYRGTYHYTIIIPIIPHHYCKTIFKDYYPNLSSV